jgi:hypothetical protein
MGKNPWKYSKTYDELIIKKKVGSLRYCYPVALQQMQNAAQILDWICQVAGKAWIDASDLGWLVKEINQRVHPQTWACSDGINNPEQWNGRVPNRRSGASTGGADS